MQCTLCGEKTGRQTPEILNSYPVLAGAFADAGVTPSQNKDACPTCAKKLANQVMREGFGNLSSDSKERLNQLAD